MYFEADLFDRVASEYFIRQDTFGIMTEPLPVFFYNPLNQDVLERSRKLCHDFMVYRSFYGVSG